MKPGYERHIDSMFKELVANAEEIKQDKFRFRGKEVEQLEDFSIKVSCVDATETIGQSSIKTKDKNLMIWRQMLRLAR